jgi:hypothetical protein
LQRKCGHNLDHVDLLEEAAGHHQGHKDIATGPDSAPHASA